MTLLPILIRVVLPAPLQKEQSPISQSVLTFLEEYSSRSEVDSSSSSARRAIITVLDYCKERLTFTSSQLRVHLIDALHRLDAFQGQTFVHPDSNEQNKLQQEIDIIKRSLVVYAKVSRDVSIERVKISNKLLVNYLENVVTKLSC